MRHLKHTAKLGRNGGHRKAMLVNMACSLIEHDQIQTTVVRAKELRRLVDRLITYGKKGGEHQRRLAYAKLKINTPSDKMQTKNLVLDKLFNDLAVRYAKRPGGYTRIIHMGTRVGDAAPICIIQLVEGDAPPVLEKAPEKPVKIAQRKKSDDKTVVKASPRKKAAKKEDATETKAPAKEAKSE